MNRKNLTMTISILIMIVSVFIASCKHKKDDKTNISGMILLLLGGGTTSSGTGTGTTNSSPLTETSGTAPTNAGQSTSTSTTVSAGSATLQKNVPVAQNLKAQSGTALTYSVAISDAASSKVSEMPSKSQTPSYAVTSSTATVYLNLVDSTGKTVANVSSVPGSSSVTLTYTPSSTGTYTIILYANSPLLVAPTVQGVTEVPSAQPQNVATVIPSATANIVAYCYNGNAYYSGSTIGCYVGKVTDSAGTTSSFSTLDTATATVGSNTITLTYYADPYGNTAVGSPWNLWHTPLWYGSNSTVPNAGDSVTVNLVKSSESLNFSQTTSIPNKVSSVTVTQNGTTQNLNGSANVTISRSYDATLAWTNPSTYVPAGVGAFLGKYTGGTIISAAATSGTMTIPAATISSSLTTTSDCDNFGLAPFLMTNNTMATSYYQGLVDTGTGTTQVTLSGIMVSAVYPSSGASTVAEGYTNSSGTTCTANTGSAKLTVQ